ncbi:fungal-specific transcription factor domain-containing protein [Mycena capillaripes]|nr:fungal-specific transcription factor domain-containing protein [Mycena capillaripes]
MTTPNSPQLLSDEKPRGTESIDLKRSRGIVACAECQRRKLKCDKKFPCSPCVCRGRADICPTGDLGPIGRGKRIMRSDLIELSTIRTMSDRIQKLETAVAEAHAKESHSTHPLLREELLAIKRTGDLPRSSTDHTPAQLVEMFGALAVSASGATRYFGPTAGPEALLSVQGSAGGDCAEYAVGFATLIEAFPFDGNSASSWDTKACLEILLSQLPEITRAWALYDVYVADASWYGTPTMPDELHELLSSIYNPNSNFHELSLHALAVMFFAFALAALADLSLPAYSSEADMYFDLGRTSLAQQSIFGSADLHTIQALALAGLYYATGGPRHSGDSAWTLISMAAGLCQTLNLHRESEHSRFDNKTAQRRRALFWEVYSLDTYQSLSVARPLAIPLMDITCEYPGDTEQTMDSEGRIIPGFFRTKWSFTKEITAPMARAYTGAKMPTYAEVLDLDRRLRKFMERAPFQHYYSETVERNPFLAYLRAHLIPRFAGNLMAYIHRGSFVQVLKDSPLNPLESPYAASFLAAYRGASMIIKSDLRSFSQFPDRFHRWWMIWKSLINACFIVGSIVAKSPTSPMAPAAFSELVAAVELVERGATHSFLAAGSLPVLQRLRNKATAVYTVSHPRLDAPLNSINPFELADDRDFELLAGSRAVVERDQLPNPPSLSTGDLPLPTLIPSLMTNSSTPDFWNTQLPDTWDSNFPFDRAPFSSTSISQEGDGLEEYIAAQMQIPSTSSFPSQASYAVSETEWSNFLSFL